MRREIHLDARRLEADGEVLHGVDPPVPQQEVQADPHEAGAEPLTGEDKTLGFSFTILGSTTYHDCVSSLEVERVEATFQFVEVLGDLHVTVGRQPVPGGGDQIGKKSCRILTEISH